MKVQVIAYTEDPEILIEDAARLCYDSFEKKGPGSHVRIIEHLIRSGHESVLEHASITFRVGGVSRALTHQLVRHRIASYSQRSQRYVSESKPQYVTPPSILDNKENIGISSQDQMAIAKFENAMLFAWNTYNELLKMGIKGEDARFVLPNACFTEIITTMNFRALRNFFKLRTSKHAQWEIRNLAKKMFNFASNIAPTVFKDIKFEEDEV